MTKYDFFNLFADGITAPEKLTKEWVYQNVYLPNPPYSIKGSCDLSISPYLIEPLKSFADPSINEIYIAATPRTGKSLFEDLLLLYTLKEQPSDILLALDTKAKANLWYKTRLRRLFEANNIKLSDDRFDTTKSCIVLDSCTIRFAGAKEEGDLSSFPSKIVLGDECWDWKKGMLAKAKTRSRDWGEYGRKNVFVSQASSAGSDFCEGWHRGQQSKFGFRCVHCGKEQVFSFTKPVKSGDGIRYAGLNWDPSAKLKSGRWDVEKAKATVFYACEQCEHRYLWTPEDRRTLASNYVYIKHNDNPETNVASYSWNCFSAPDKYPWGDIVSEWLGAVNTNNKKNRKNFYI